MLDTLDHVEHNCMAFGLVAVFAILLWVDDGRVGYQSVLGMIWSLA